MLSTCDTDMRKKATPCSQGDYNLLGEDYRTKESWKGLWVGGKLFSMGICWKNPKECKQVVNKRWLALETFLNRSAIESEVLGAGYSYQYPVGVSSHADVIFVGWWRYRWRAREIQKSTVKWGFQMCKNYLIGYFADNQLLNGSLHCNPACSVPWSFSCSRITI